MSSISRKAYAEMYGPTTGDRVRLGDTELFIESFWRQNNIAGAKPIL